MLLDGVDLGVDRLLGLDAEVDLLRPPAHCGASGVIWQMSIAAARCRRRRPACAVALAAARASAPGGAPPPAHRRPASAGAASASPPRAAERSRAEPARYRLGLLLLGVAACGSSTRAAASRSHLRACFIATPSASFEALASRVDDLLRGTALSHLIHDASCVKSENCWGIRLTAKVSATISARFRLSNGIC